MSKTTIVKKFNRFSYDDWAYLESWLQDMAASGLVLKRFGLFVSEFEVTEPADMRFRLLPKDYYQLDADEKDMYEVSGWKIVDGNYGSDRPVILYTYGDGAPELFTDRASYSQYARKFRRLNFFNTVLSVLMVLCWIWVFHRDLTVGSLGIAHAIYEYGLGTWLCFSFAAVVIITVMTIQTYKRYDAAKQLLEGTTIDHHIDHSSRGRLNTLCQVLGVVMIACLIPAMIAIALTDASSGVSTIEESLAADTSMMVGIQSFAPEEWEKGLPLFQESPASLEDEDNYEYEEGREYASYRVETQSSRIMPTDMDMTFSIYTARDNEGFYDHDNSVWYFEELKQARSDRFAVSFFESEIAGNYRFMTGRKMPAGFIEDIAIESDDADYVGYYDTRDLDTSRIEAHGYELAYISQELYVRKGEWMILVSYEGDKDLRDSVDMYIDKINALSRTE